jgi:hypothetical protein
MSREREVQAARIVKSRKLEIRTAKIEMSLERNTDGSTLSSLQNQPAECPLGSTYIVRKTFMCKRLTEEMNIKINFQRPAEITTAISKKIMMIIITIQFLY